METAEDCDNSRCSRLHFTASLKSLNFTFQGKLMRAEYILTTQQLRDYISFYFVFQLFLEEHLQNIVREINYHRKFVTVQNSYIVNS